MRRYTLLIAVLLIAVVATAPWIWWTFISPRADLEIDPMTYTEDSTWAALPVETPPPVWVDGWGIDVFLVTDAAGLQAKSEKGLGKAEQKARLQSQELRTSLRQIGPVYAPLYRAAAKSDDLSRAFETYMRTVNKGRALVIVHDTPLPVAMLSRLETDEALKTRFGGFLTLARDEEALPVLMSEAGGTSLSAYCSEEMNTASTCQTWVPVTRSRGISVLPTDEMPGGERMAAFPDWLEANANKMAEPLGDFEEVDIIDIRRPGDTDARRQKK